MPLLSSLDQERLRTDFSALIRDVRLVFFTQVLECETCVATREILDELPAVSSRITIHEVDFLLDRAKADAYGIDRAPAIAVVGVDESGHERDSGIRFLGAPSGYEFVALVRAILVVGGAVATLSERNRALVAAVDTPVTVRVFSTPTCPHCPRAIALAQEMAFVNPHITAIAVEATEFPDLSRRYRVTGVPKTVVDDRIEILGALPEDDYVAQVLGLSPSDTPIEALR